MCQCRPRSNISQLLCHELCHSVKWDCLGNVLRPISVHYWLCQTPCVMNMKWAVYDSFSRQDGSRTSSQRSCYESFFKWSKSMEFSQHKWLCNWGEEFYQEVATCTPTDGVWASGRIEGWNGMKSCQTMSFCTNTILECVLLSCCFKHTAWISNLH